MGRPCGAVGGWGRVVAADEEKASGKAHQGCATGPRQACVSGTPPIFFGGGGRGASFAQSGWEVLKFFHLEGASCAQSAWEVLKASYFGGGGILLRSLGGRL